MTRFKLQFFLLIAATLGILSGCGDDDGEGPSGPNPTGNTKTFNLTELAVPGISGTAQFIENDDASTTVEIKLQNTPAGGDHPAHIHFNTAAEGGDIAITLGSVDGDSGESTITFSATDAGIPITYNDLLDFDGYINVHLSAGDLATIVAQGDIGQNELSGESKTYTLNESGDSGISGTILFEERTNGEALATITLANTPQGGIHPAHIHENSAIETGGILLTLNPVGGSTGMSKTNISTYDNGSDASYGDMLSVNGYVNVHLSPQELETIVAQGDIGQNELTGEMVVYPLLTKDVDGISGEAIFAERQNGTTLVTINLEGTPEGGIHPAHIHMNDAATGGDIAISLNSVDGTSGTSSTQVASTDMNMLILYEDLLEFDGYINVHLSADQLATIVAQGNIGSNAGEDIGGTINYDVTNSGSAAYVFNGGDFTDTQNPDITLQRGRTYVFNVDAAGHPFYIKDTQSTGTGNAYNEGVTNNGAESGMITFVVPEDAPETLFYNCEFHSPMTGTITITD